MISVVIPLYNKVGQVEATLRSVLAQTYKDYEIVVVDDGSTDGSAEKVESLGIENLRLIRQKNAGVSAARNRGIEEAKGEYVAFLDADDLWKPDYLATQYELTKKYPECDVFATNYEMHKANGDILKTVIHKLPFNGLDGVLDNYFEVASCSHPPLWTSAVMVRKSSMNGCNVFPIGVASGEDLLTWANLAVNFEIAYSNVVGASYTFIEKIERRGEPKDIKSTKDAVGIGLEKILDGVFEKRLRHDLKKYVSFWYKMRSSINLSLHHRLAAVTCAIKSLRYNPCNIKVYSFPIVAMLPATVIDIIIRKLRK